MRRIGLWVATGVLFTFSGTLTPVVSLSEAVYFVATDGDDNNQGTMTAPFRTFDAANEVLEPGDALRIFGGTYEQVLHVTASGTEDLPIVIGPVDGEEVVIDTAFDSNRTVKLSGDYIHFEGITVRGSTRSCLDVEGDHIVVRDVVVSDCDSHGIHIQGTNVLVESSVVSNTALANQDRDMSGGWASGIKIREGEFVTLENNTVFHNYGEGIAARGRHVTIRRNRIYDNFSMNIYMGNSFDFLVAENFVTCGENTGFERGGQPAVGIGMAEEYYPDWGAQLGQITIRNNIVAYCWQGITYGGAESEIEDEAGLDTVTIVHNTLWGILERGILIQDEPPKTRDSIVANNIVQSEGRQAVIKPEQGVEYFNNFWVGTARLINGDGRGDMSGDPGIRAEPGDGPEKFRLAWWSAAIDTGEEMGVDADFEGNSRVVPDMGAIEYMGPRALADLLKISLYP